MGWRSITISTNDSGGLCPKEHSKGNVRERNYKSP